MSSPTSPSRPLSFRAIAVGGAVCLLIAVLGYLGGSVIVAYLGIDRSGPGPDTVLLGMLGVLLIAFFVFASAVGLKTRRRAEATGAVEGAGAAGGAGAAAGVPRAASASASASASGSASASASASGSASGLRAASAACAVAALGAASLVFTLVLASLGEGG